MSLVAAADARALGVGLDLDDAALQAVLDREEAEVVRRFGPNAGDGVTQAETTYPRGRSVYLRRAVASVVGVTECLSVGDAPTSRAVGDYVLWGSEGRIERAAASPPWGAVVTVTYVPADDSDLRRSVVIELARVATEQTSGAGLDVAGLGYRIGGGSATARAWQQARDAQYARLGYLS